MNYINAKIVIIPAISLNLLKRQGDAVIQPDRRSPKQYFCYIKVSFGYFFPPNQQNLACLINEIIMQSDKVV